LLTRQLARGEGPQAEADLARSLELCGARRMVIGHTQTRTVPGGRMGQILTRHRGRLVCIDVSMSQGDATPRVALVIDGAVGSEWSPSGLRELWRDPPPA
jgi:hypothetical protein